jgi:hypothetical protein
MDEFFKSRLTKWDFKPDPESKDIRNPKVILRKDGIVYHPTNWQEISRVNRDFGIVLRGPSPMNKNLMVTILAGRSALGTEAACLAVTDPDCFRKLMRKIKQSDLDPEDHRQAFIAFVSIDCIDNNGKGLTTALETFRVWSIKDCP